MRAVSLWQPWASAAALGSKLIETRHWSTKYRGPLAIHAAQRRNIGDLTDYHGQPQWQGALYRAGWRPEHRPVDDISRLPFGRVVAVCDLTDCRPVEDFTPAQLNAFRYRSDAREEAFAWTEADMGNFADGRFGWVLENIRALAEPIPFKGGQSFFTVPDELLDTAQFLEAA